MQELLIGPFYDFRSSGLLDHGFQRNIAEIFQQKAAEATVKGIDSGSGEPLFS